MTAGTDEGRRTPPLIAAAFGLIIVLLCFSIGLQAGVINPTAQSNQSALNSQGAEIRAVACAQAESTANAFRFRQIGPNGKTESREHFVTRMLAQQHTLEAAQQIGCTSAKGFPPFEKQVSRALHEIAVILAADHHMHRSTAAAKTTAVSGGDATSSPSTGHSQPAPGDGGGSQPASSGSHGSPAPGKGGSGDAPAPGQPGSTAPSTPPASTPSQPSSSSTTERSAGSTVVETAPDAPVREGLGGVVTETGESVTGVVEGVQETTCSLAAALCK